MEVGIHNSSNIEPILRAEHFDEPLHDDEVDDVQLSSEDGRGMHILHACSGPDRPGAYSRYISARGASCRDFDIVRDPSDDLTCQVAWMKLADEVSKNTYHGMQAGPNCRTFSAVRGKQGGPP